MGWVEYQKLVELLAEKIISSKKKYNGIIAIPRGALPIATSLSHILNIKTIVFEIEKAEKNYLVVDDVSDKGNTLEKYKGYDIACLCYKPQTKVMPDFWAKKYNDNEWIYFPWEIIGSKTTKDNQ